MIRGLVTHELEAVVRLTVLGRRGRRQNVEAVVDTGFDGYLSLSPNFISQLGLPWLKRGRAILADGSESLFDVYQGHVIWDRRRREILIDEADADPLVGMALMANFELRAQIWPGGDLVLRRKA
jgi:clan AA aspartic protease